MDFKFLINLAMSTVKAKGVPLATTELSAGLSAENARTSAGVPPEKIATTVETLVALGVAELNADVTALAAHFGIK
jgi:hypothetical protein